MAKDKVKIITLPSRLAGSDEQAVGINKVAAEVLKLNLNKLPLFMFGLGRMTRRQLVAQMDALAEVARQAGYYVIRDSDEGRHEDPFEVC